MVPPLNSSVNLKYASLVPRPSLLFNVACNIERLGEPGDEARYHRHLILCFVPGSDGSRSFRISAYQIDISLAGKPLLHQNERKMM